MSHDFLPPQEFNGRGDPLMPSYGFTGKGDLILQQTNACGDIIDSNILEYTGKGDPCYVETTVRGDIISRQIIPRSMFLEGKVHHMQLRSEWIFYTNEELTCYVDPATGDTYFVYNDGEIVKRTAEEMQEEADQAAWEEYIASYNKTEETSE